MLHSKGPSCVLFIKYFQTFLAIFSPPLEISNLKHQMPSKSSCGKMGSIFLDLGPPVFLNTPVQNDHPKVLMKAAFPPLLTSGKIASKYSWGKWANAAPFSNKNFPCHDFWAIRFLEFRHQTGGSAAQFFQELRTKNIFQPFDFKESRHQNRGKLRPIFQELSSWGLESTRKCYFPLFWGWTIKMGSIFPLLWSQVF